MFNMLFFHLFHILHIFCLFFGRTFIWGQIPTWRFYEIIFLYLTYLMAGNEFKEVINIDIFLGRGFKEWHIVLLGVGQGLIISNLTKIIKIFFITNYTGKDRFLTIISYKL